jgi:hypothetical protein
VFGQAVTARAPVRMTLEDWNLFDSIPAWKDATLGTVEERKAKMSRPELRGNACGLRRGRHGDLEHCLW